MISYRTFKRQVFNRIGERKRNTLFYWSLFDPSSWEETSQPRHFPNFTRGQFSVLKILRCSRMVRGLLRSAEDQDKFKRNFIYAEFLTNYLIAAEIEKKMRNLGLRGIIDIRNLGNTQFPDIIIRGTKIGRVNIEIKGKVGAKNLTDRVKNEVIPKINKNKRDFNNFLLLLLFPTCKQESGMRVEELVGGYYVFEEILKTPALRKEQNRKVLAKSVQLLGNKYTLSSLVNRILDFIKR